MIKKSSFRTSILTAVILALSTISIGNINAEKVSAYESVYHDELLINGDFANERSKPWYLEYLRPCLAEGYVGNCSYTVEVKKIDNYKKNERDGVYLCQKNLNLEAGKTYDISFTVKPDHDCKIYPKVSSTSYMGEEYWNCEGDIRSGKGNKTWIPIELKANEERTIKGSFVMNKTVKNAMLSFNMTGDCTPDGITAYSDETYRYTFSDISLKKHTSFTPPCTGYSIEKVKDGNFTDKIYSPWILKTFDEGEAEGKIEDGAYNITVKNNGNSDYDRWKVMLCQKNIELKSGYVYKVSFDVTADHDCSIYPMVGDFGEPYNEYWNCDGQIGNNTTWVPIKLKAGEKKTINGSFKMINRNVKRSCLAFCLGGACAPKNNIEPYSYSISNVSLKELH